MAVSPATTKTLKAMTYPNYSAAMHHLSDQLTPMVLRKTVWRALVQVILRPVEALSTDYSTFRAAKRQRMEHNGQVRLLERICNILMVSSYSPNSPLIYLDEPEPIYDFIISPDGQWELQSSIHYDQYGKIDWNTQNHDPEEEPEQYSILHDRSGHSAGLGFIVHISTALGPDAPNSYWKTRFYTRGGETALRSIVDTYKLAGKQYTIVWDEE